MPAHLDKKFRETPALSLALPRLIAPTPLQARGGRAQWTEALTRKDEFTHVMGVRVKINHEASSSTGPRAALVVDFPNKSLNDVLKLLGLLDYPPIPEAREKGFRIPMDVNLDQPHPPLKPVGADALELMATNQHLAPAAHPYIWLRPKNGRTPPLRVMLGRADCKGIIKIAGPALLLAHVMKNAGTIDQSWQNFGFDVWARQSWLSPGVRLGIEVLPTPELDRLFECSIDPKCDLMDASYHEACVAVRQAVETKTGYEMPDFVRDVMLYAYGPTQGAHLAKAHFFSLTRLPDGNPDGLPIGQSVVAYEKSTGLAFNGYFLGMDLGYSGRVRMMVHDPHGLVPDPAPEAVNMVSLKLDQGWKYLVNSNQMAIRPTAQQSSDRQVRVLADLSDEVGNLIIATTDGRSHLLYTLKGFSAASQDSVRLKVQKYGFPNARLLERNETMKSLILDPRPRRFKQPTPVRVPTSIGTDGKASPHISDSRRLDYWRALEAQGTRDPKIVLTDKAGRSFQGVFAGVHTEDSGLQCIWVMVRQGEAISSKRSAQVMNSDFPHHLSHLIDLSEFQAELIETPRAT